MAAGIVSIEKIKLLESRGVLPEYVYGLAERHFGPHVYDAWKSLELWRAHPGAFSANAGHLTAVQVAVRSETPLLTPNFDTFLEDAAERLGVVPKVTVAVPGRPFAPLPAGPGQVAIWKLHGTAVDPQTVFSSVRTLTRPIPGLQDHLRDAVPDTARLVFAGYSGRDLDLFPVMSAKTRRHRPIWVDLRFSAEHRARLLVPAALEVTGPFDEVGRRYAAFADDDFRAAVGGADLLSGTAAHASASPKLSAAVDGAFESVADDLSDEAGRRLLFGELFINAGMSRAAVDVLAVKTLTKKRCSSAQVSERARLLAKAHWELGEFAASRTIARERLRDGIPPAERDALRFAVTAAEVRALVPPGGLPGSTPAPRHRILLLGLAALVSFLRAAHRARHPELVEEPTRTPLAEGWTEHGIRLMAVLQVLVTRTDGSMPRLLLAVLSRAWKLLRSTARQMGYAEGIGNAGRYLARLNAGDPDGDRTAHEFLGHFLGVAIAHRDAARRALQGGDIALARREFDRGLEIARLQEDPVLLLSFAPLADCLGLPLALDDALIGQIEADWAVEYLARKRAAPRGSGIA